MRMKALLSAVLLGLFCLVRSTTINSVTQIPAKAEDDVLLEAEMDGFLVKLFESPSLTTRKTTTPQPTSQPSTAADERLTAIEGSAAGETAGETAGEFPRRGNGHATTMRPTSTMPHWVADFYTSRSSATQSPETSETLLDGASRSSTTQSPQTSTTPHEGADFHASRSSTTQIPQTSTMPHDAAGFHASQSSTTQNPQTSTTPHEGADFHASRSSTTQIPQTSTMPHEAADFHTSQSSTTESPQTSTMPHEGASQSSTTQTPQTSTVSSSAPNVTGGHGTTSQAPEPADSGFFSGSGENETLDALPTSWLSGTSSSTAATDPASAASTTTASTVRQETPGGEESGSGSVMPDNVGSTTNTLVGAPRGQPSNDPESRKGHSTPDWIIIVGFIVGVIALVMLCLAIATKDKWNGPKQAQTKDKPSPQQRETEMETFLRNDTPKENGKADEYTVISLEELPDKYSQ